MNSFNAKDDCILMLLRDGSPSLQEIGDEIGLRAISSVHERIERLEKAGLVVVQKGQHRSRSLTELGEKYLEENYGTNS